MKTFSSTTDLNIASFLVAKHYVVKELVRINPRQVRFIFEEDIDQAEVDNFYNNEAVGVSDYAQANKNLKARLHNTP